MSENVVRVLFIGAGAVNFGGAEGPWDHACRLEQLEDVYVVAIANRKLINYVCGGTTTPTSTTNQYLLPHTIL